MDQLGQINTAYAANLKLVRAGAEDLNKQIAERGKEMATLSKTPDKVTGKFILDDDVARLEGNRRLAMDFAYVQMQEHSRKLEEFGGLFEKTMGLIDVEKEFIAAMAQIQKFSNKDIDEFIGMKQRERGQAAKAGQRSQSAGPPVASSY